ncbi:MAG TPA: recombinase family protein [Ktedonobacterales bacterium]|nr:recombinase family protein [Ktedonobacterales bacterium]
MQVVDIYARVSTDAQEDNTSFEEQEDACRQYCRENGLEVGMVHRELFSGYNYRDRQKLTLMRQRYREGVIQGFVIRTVDRLSRNQTHLAVILEEVEHYGIALHCVKEKFDNTPMGKFILAALALVAEVEREKFLDRGISGKIALAKQGKIVGGKHPRYGWKWHDQILKDYLLIDEEQAEVLRWAAKEYADGATIMGLVVQLQERQVPTPTGQPLWTRNALRRLLTDVRNTGTGAQMFTNPSPKAKRNLDPVDLPDGTYPPIFDMETYQQILIRAQANKEEAARNGSAPENFLLRAGFVYCAKCSGRMAGCKIRDWRNKGGDYRYVYICAKTHKCPGYRVVARRLDEMVWDELVQLADHITLIEEAVQLATNRDNTSANLKAVERALAEWKDKADMFNDDLKDTRLRGPTRATIRKSLDDALEMAERLEGEKQKLLAGEYDRQREREAYGEILEWCRKVKGAREELPYQKKRDYLRLLGVEVSVHHLKRGKSGDISYDIHLALPALQALVGAHQRQIVEQCRT